jgi:tetratricopeptide (TPR) repeat protein
VKTARQIFHRALCLVFAITLVGQIASADSFREGVVAYNENDFTRAADIFSQLSTNAPSAGVWRNLGNTHWKQNQIAAAMLAWERASWMDPFDAAIPTNLKFARNAAQLEAPELTWYEIASTWLPLNWWAVLATISLWLAVGGLFWPTVLHRNKSATQQAVVALGLGVFLLSLPANFGAATRTKIGFVLQRDTPLRLTPTLEGEPITRLAAGDPARVVRVRGDYLLVQTRRTRGWLRHEEFEFICPR